MAAGTAWFLDDRWYDLLVVLDDATSEVYYAQLVEQESTRTVMAALRAVVEGKGVFCALYSDRASHFFATPQAGGKVRSQAANASGKGAEGVGHSDDSGLFSPGTRAQRTQLRDLAGRLPRELRLRGITTVEAANEFLGEEYIAEFNERFCEPPAQPGSAFLPCRRKDLDLFFSLRHERSVARDNTIELGERTLQIEPVGWRTSLAGCRALVHEHLDGTLTVSYGPHIVGRYNAQSWPLLEDKRGRRKAVEKPLRLGIPQPRRHSHFSTATAANDSP